MEIGNELAVFICVGAVMLLIEWGKGGRKAVCSGIAALLFLVFLPFHVPLNIITGGICAGLGLPGYIMLVVWFQTIV